MVSPPGGGALGSGRVQSITEHLIGSPRDEPSGYPYRPTDGEEGHDRSGGGDEGEDEHNECSDEEQTTLVGSFV